MNRVQAMRRSGALPAVALAATLAGCGGGVVPDPGGTSPDVRLNCGGACLASDTLDTSQITAMMYVVDDGTRTQAQAGFNADGSLFHNVELQGDTLWLVGGGTSQRMLLAREGAWDFFQDLVTLGQPYLADIAPQPTAARAYEFQLRRAGGTVASQVTLPAPFTIGSPGANQVVAIGSAAVPVTVTAPLALGNFNIGFTCTDANGNQTGSRVPDGQWLTQLDSSGESFRFNVPAFLASLTWNQDVAPAAPVTRCDIRLQALVASAGTLSPAFHAYSIVQGTQVRYVTFLLR